MQHMEASPIARRSRVADVDVRAIRTRMRMTQQRFADVFGLPVSNVRDREQGRSAPDQAARVLLRSSNIGRTRCGIHSPATGSR